MDMGEVGGTLQAIFTFLMVTGGGSLVYAVLDRSPLSDLTPVNKRLAAGALSALFAVIGYLGLTAIGVYPPPSCGGDFWRRVWCWAEFPLNLMAWQFLISQGIHLRDLPRTR